MAEQIKFPDIGAGVNKGEVIKWLVSQGDQVQEDENILYIETYKALVEIPTPQSGRIVEIKCNPGDTVNVGDTLALIEPT